MDLQQLTIFLAIFANDMYLLSAFSINIISASSQQKKKVKNNSTDNMEPVQTSISRPQVTKNVAFEEDPSVIQSEMIKTKDSLVSMSVGEPEVATNVVKDWLQQEAPPAPVESKPEPSVSDQESEDNNKKSKKKK